MEMVITLLVVLAALLIMAANTTVGFVPASMVRTGLITGLVIGGALFFL